MPLIAIEVKTEDPYVMLAFTLQDFDIFTEELDILEFPYLIIPREDLVTD